MAVGRKLGITVGAICALLFSGCASVLPSNQNRTFTAWSTFEEAKKAYDSIIIGRTDFKSLTKLGFDPFRTPNVRRLTYLDVIKIFMPNPTIGIERLDHGVRRCIEERENCYAIEANPRYRKKRRYGNAALDLLNFRKETEVSGWEFRAVVVLVDDVAVYKIWSGVPIFLEHGTRKNPLGPIEGARDFLLD